MKAILFSIFLSFLFLISCSKSEKSEEAVKTVDTPKPKSMIADPMANKGIGPVKSVTLEQAINTEMATQGKVIYEAKCTACHKADVKFIGPAPKGILDRRSPEWVMNMILNPEEMTKNDPIAKQLFTEFNGTPMANQNLTEEEARKVLEYFRTI